MDAAHLRKVKVPCPERRQPRGSPAEGQSGPIPVLGPQLPQIMRRLLRKPKGLSLRSTLRDGTSGSIFREDAKLSSRVAGPPTFTPAPDERRSRSFIIQLCTLSPLLGRQRCDFPRSLHLGPLAERFRRRSASSKDTGPSASGSRDPTTRGAPGTGAGQAPAQPPPCPGPPPPPPGHDPLSVFSVQAEEAPGGPARASVQTQGPRSGVGGDTLQERAAGTVCSGSPEPGGRTPVNAAFSLRPSVPPSVRFLSSLPPSRCFPFFPPASLPPSLLPV